MTTQEFSIEFDILYNNLASNTAPPLNNYEKSVFLTKAQSDIVIELYSGRNNLGLSYESSEEIRRYLDNLSTEYSKDISNPDEALVDPSSEMWLITMEVFNDVPVIPVSQDEYLRIRKNPFKKSSNLRRILRVCKGESEYLDLPTGTQGTYTAYGLRKPKPIILDGIGDPTLTIEGYPANEPLTCELDSSMHRMILDRAILYAKQAYIGGQLQE